MQRASDVAGIPVCAALLRKEPVAVPIASCWHRTDALLAHRLAEINAYESSNPSTRFEICCFVASTLNLQLVSFSLLIASQGKESSAAAYFPVSCVE